MPRLTSTGLPPSSIAFMPSRTIACASTVAVVVPSPTMSLVLIAASLTSCAPMFSNWSRRWISRAIVTPSLVTTGRTGDLLQDDVAPLGAERRLDGLGQLVHACQQQAASFLAEAQFLGHVDRPTALQARDEDGAAAHPAGVEIVQRVEGGVERVGLGVQRDLARLGQHHQLGQVVVGADDVADDVALGGDDVERRDVERAAVADDVVRAGRRGSSPARRSPRPARPTKSSTTCAPGRRSGP